MSTETETKEKILSHLKPLLQVLRGIENDPFPARECYVEAIYEYLEMDGVVEDEDSLLWEGAKS
jgi:hypothetical protein